MVLCEIDCELEFTNSLCLADMTYIDYSLKKNLRKTEIYHQKLYALPLQQSVRLNINKPVLLMFYLIKLPASFYKSVNLDILNYSNTVHKMATSKS